MKEEIYILGSGGLSKEIYCLIKDINSDPSSNKYQFKGFVDIRNDISFLTIGAETFPVIDEEKFLLENINKRNINLAVGIGKPEVIKKTTAKFKDKNKFIFPNLIHPNTVGNFDDIRIGTGNVITAGCIFTTSITIGSFNIFNLNSTVGHDAIIGSCNVINPGCNISGGAKIGDANLIGTNAAVLQYISIGNASIIGAGGVVNRDIKDDSVAVGVPCKIIKENI